MQAVCHPPATHWAPFCVVLGEPSWLHDTHEGIADTAGTIHVVFAYNTQLPIDSALAHESAVGGAHGTLRWANSLPDDRLGLRLAQLSHPVQYVAPDHRLSSLRFVAACMKAVSERALVPEEKILDRALSAVPILPSPSLSADITNRLEGCVPLRPRALGTIRRHCPSFEVGSQF